MVIKSLPVPDSHKRDILFLILAGFFLTALVLGNVIGTTKFVTIFSFNLPDWLQSITPSIVREDSIYTMSIPVGLLAYPFTFVATDLISELYGRKKAQLVVWIGFFMNLYMLFLMSIGHWLPNTGGVSGGISLFEGVYDCLIANTLASMVAYLIAQSIDVRLYHFWKRTTNGKYLWIRNNGSTMFSQLIDSITILTILYLSGNLGTNINSLSMLGILIINSYIFKFCFAIVDTPIIYLWVKVFKNYEEDPEAYRFQKA